MQFEHGRLARGSRARCACHNQTASLPETRLDCPENRTMKRYLPVLIIAGMLIVVAVAAFAMLRSKEAGATGPFTSQSGATPPAVSPAMATPGPREIKSPSNVSVTLEEYGDYQCPPCGLLHPELKKIKAEYGPRINFVFRNLPLTKMHKNALVAAQAAEAARLQDRFWEMHDLIYENQNVWKDEANPLSTFTKYARDLGLDVKRFGRDMESSEVQQRLAEDTKSAESLDFLRNRS